MNVIIRQIKNCALNVNIYYLIKNQIKIWNFTKLVTCPNVGIKVSTKISRLNEWLVVKNKALFRLFDL